MTTQTVLIDTRDYGASLTSCTLRDVTTDVLVATADSVNEVTTDGGLYAAVFGEVSVIAAGTYRVRGVISGQPITRYVTLAGIDTEVAISRSERLAELDSAALRAALGMSAADLDAQLDAILANNGTGARTVTITVNDGTTVLQNAVVRFTEGSNTYRALTNASGVATFNLDDATYTVAVSKVGYYYAGTTMIVNGTETATYSMTAINVTPGMGDLTTGYLTCLDEEGVAEEGVSVRCQVVQIPASGTGFAYDSAVRFATSDEDGLVEFPMLKGARYLIWRGSVKPPAGIVPVLISASAGSTTALGSLIGD